MDAGEVAGRSPHGTVARRQYRRATLPSSGAATSLHATRARRRRSREDLCMTRLAWLALFAVAATAAHAHIDIDIGAGEAAPGTDLRLAFAVSHGCGDASTTAI